MRQFISIHGYSNLEKHLSEKRIQQCNDSMTKTSAHFASQVIGIKYVKSDGTLGQTSDPNELFYWRNNYGLLGIVYDVQLKVIPNFTWKVANSIVPLQDLINYCSQVSTRKVREDSFWAFVSPYSESAWLSKKTKMNRSKVDEFFTKISFGIWAELYPFFITTGLDGTNQLNTTLAQLFGNSYRKSYVEILRIVIAYLTYYVSANDRVLPISGFARQDLCEVAVPQRLFSAAITDVCQTLQQFSSQTNWYLLGVFVIYYLPQDTSSILSRSYDEDHIAIDMFHGNWTEPLFQQFRAIFINLLISKYEARPHYAKTSGDPSLLSLKNYDPNLIEQYRSQIDQTLLNPFFRQVFF